MYQTVSTTETTRNVLQAKSTFVVVATPLTVATKQFAKLSKQESNTNHNMSRQKKLTATYF